MPSEPVETRPNEVTDPPAGSRPDPNLPVALPVRSGTDWPRIVTIAVIVALFAGFLLFVELIHYGF
jgi:hypothetical protein